MLNSENLLGDHNYGIEYYQRKKNPSQIFSFLKLKLKKNFFLLAISWIISRFKKLTRSNPKIMCRFILPSVVLGDKV